MDCRSVQENIGLFVDGQLSEAEQRQMADHTASCASCRKELDDVVRLQNALQSLGELEPPPGLAQAAINKARKKKPVYAYASVFMAAAAAVIALVVVVSSGSLPKGETAASQDAPVAYSINAEMESAVGEEMMDIMAFDDAVPMEEPTDSALMSGGRDKHADGGESAVATSANVYESEDAFSKEQTTLYFKPLSLPEGAVLEQITVTDEVTTFLYLLPDQSQFLFEWLSAIPTYGLKDYLDLTFGVTSDIAFDGRYYVLMGTDSQDVYWEQDGNVFHALVPISYTIADIEAYCMAQMN